MEKLKERWERCIFIRTTKKSDIPYKWFLKMWYNKVFSYNDEQDRILMIYKIGENMVKNSDLKK